MTPKTVRIASFSALVVALLAPAGFATEKPTYITLREGGTQETVTSDARKTRFELSEPLFGPRRAVRTPWGLAVLDGDGLVKYIDVTSGEVRVAFSLQGLTVKDLVLSGDLGFYALTDQGVLRVDRYVRSTVLGKSIVSQSATAVAVSDMGGGKRRIFVGTTTDLQTFELSASGLLRRLRTEPLPAAASKIGLMTIKGQPRLVVGMDSGSGALCSLDGAILSVVSSTRSARSGPNTLLIRVGPGSQGDLIIPVEDVCNLIYLGWDGEPAVCCREYCYDNTCHYYCWNV